MSTAACIFSKRPVFYMNEFGKTCKNFTSCEFSVKSIVKCRPGCHVLPVRTTAAICTACVGVAVENTGGVGAGVDEARGAAAAAVVVAAAAVVVAAAAAAAALEDSSGAASGTMIGTAAATRRKWQAVSILGSLPTRLW